MSTYFSLLPRPPLSSSPPPSFLSLLLPPSPSSFLLLPLLLQVPVKPKEFYNPVQSLLVESSSSKDAKEATTGDAGDDANAPWGVHEKNKRSKDAWQETLALRTVGKLRYDEKLKAPMKKDSLYKPIVRTKKRFNPLRVPEKLQVRHIRHRMVIL